MFRLNQNISSLINIYKEVSCISGVLHSFIVVFIYFVAFNH